MKKWNEQMSEIFKTGMCRKITENTIVIAAMLGSISYASAADVSNPDGMIDLKVAPSKVFTGRIFFQNDWNWGDRDNVNVGEELNKNSKIKEGVTVLTQFPNRNPSRVVVNGVIDDPKTLATASKKEEVAFVMGGGAVHAIAWLTALPKSSYNYNNIILVSHSNYNESDGATTKDTHGIDLRRGDYPNLAKISDLGITIWEIPRTDHVNGGWGGRVNKTKKKFAAIKAYDISDLGMVAYLKTADLNPDRVSRNKLVSDEQKKPETLAEVKSSFILRYWEEKRNHNRNLPGVKADYAAGGKFYTP